MEQIQRTAAEGIRKKLSRSPAVAILGPRQVGKTYLARQIAKELSKPAVWLDLEDADDLNKLDDPGIYLRSQQDKLVVIDEIQRKPELFPLLRVLIDENRQSGRFLLTGSASPDFIRDSAESLAGRISYLHLGGISLLEAPEIALNTRWLRGGYPDALLAPDDEAASEWLADLLEAYLFRDLPMLGLSVPQPVVRRLWTMIGHSQSSITNVSLLSKSLGITRQKVIEVIEYLEAAFLIFRLEPFYINVKKRLVKSPKFYVKDCGLLHSLLHIRHFDALAAHPVAGGSFEGMAIEMIVQSMPGNLQHYFYRTQDGAEIDLLLVNSLQPVAAIEIKRSNAPKTTKGLTEAVKTLEVPNTFILTPGSDDYPVSENVRVCSIHDFLKDYLPRLS
ncbi:MAG: ATP-binding protein [Bacteroidia bacterium]